MPYYCSVPKCTSMAGKAKNVSFHKFPRDDDLAELWNTVLLRGKPYTKYSKVCSLHFTPDDYTTTRAGYKNKGLWRSLKKNAIPSRNLPGALIPHQMGHVYLRPPQNIIQARIQQQMAHAMLVQTMYLMQAASITAMRGEQLPSLPELLRPECPFASNDTTHQNFQQEQSTKLQNKQKQTNTADDETILKTQSDEYQCKDCSKYFEDKILFVLHKCTNTQYNGNTDERLKANPMLANLLLRNQPKIQISDEKNIQSIENQITKALTSNMENFGKNLSSIITDGNAKNGFQDVSQDGGQYGGRASMVN